MAETEVTHSESWTLVIYPGPGESWPDCVYPYGRDGKMMRPVKITVTLRRGSARGPYITLAAYLLKQNGTPGVRLIKYTLHGAEDGLDWVTEIVEHERSKVKLGPGTTGCGW